MVKEAEAKADEDKKFKEEIEEKNKADSMVYAAEKAVSETREKDYAEQVKTQVDNLEAAANELRDLLKNEGDIETIKQKSIDIQNVMVELSKAAAPFEQPEAGAEAPEGAEASTNEDSADDDVIDADFKATSVD